MSDLLDSRLGPYDILEKLGEGAMATVYRARRVDTGRTVALKVLGPALSSEQAVVERFMREAELVATLKHDNIVRGFEAGEERGLRYVAMEFVQGRTAGDLMKMRAVVPEATALVIARHVALALEHAESKKMIHRDVKPGNILLSSAGLAKLADFGLARSVMPDIARLTQAGTIMGTPHYMSPEQARGDREIDIRSDIYSLGSSLYHMVTGRTAFEETSALALLGKIVSERPVPPRQRNPDVTEQANALIEKMMSVEPDERFHSPTQLLAALNVLWPASDGPDMTIAFLSRASEQELGERNWLRQEPGAEVPDSDSDVTPPTPVMLSAIPALAATRPKITSTRAVLEDPLLAAVPTVEGAKRLGNVVLLKKLGQGGMGAVYRGRHELLDMDVAVKIMLFHLTADPAKRESLRQRFLREARLAARLDHRGIVRLHEVSTDAASGLTYLVMEYVDGKSAAAVMERLAKHGRKLSEMRLLEIGVQAAEALHAAHLSGVVHRDVKPGNLLVRKGDWAVKLADLGLAKSIGQEDSLGVSRSDASVGTPGYMAPEQVADSRHVGPAADIYSLGASLYHLATGEMPFKGENLLQLATRITHEAARPPTEINPDVSANAERIIARAMAKDPADRYPTAADMADDLRRAMRALPTQLVVIDAVDPAVAARRTGAARPRALTMLLLAVLLAVSAVYAYHQYLVSRLLPGLGGPGALGSDGAYGGVADQARSDLYLIDGLERAGEAAKALERAREAAARYAKTPLARVFAERAARLQAAVAANDEFAAALREIERMVKEGRLEEALARGEQAVGRPPAGPLTGRAPPALARLDGELARVRRLLAGKAALAAVDELARDGSLDEARELASAGAEDYAGTELAQEFLAREAVLRARLGAAAGRRDAAEHDRLLDAAVSQLSARDAPAAVGSSRQALAIMETPEALAMSRAAEAMSFVLSAHRESEAGRHQAAAALVAEALATLGRAPGDVPEARAAAVRAVREEAEREEEKIRRAVACVKEVDAARESLGAGDLDAAERHLATAAALDDGGRAEAVAGAKQEVVARRRFASALSAAGAAVARSALDEAEGCLKEALAVEPDSVEAKGLLAEVRRRRALPRRITNGVGMDLVLVRGGEFMMGSAQGRSDETPVHRTVLSPYYLGRCEVTNRQFELFRAGHAKERSKYSPGDDHPVVNVAYDDAAEFCAWLSAREGRGYRLPTEAEWEFAARGEKLLVYPWGNAAPGGSGRPPANVKETASLKDGHACAAPVGSFPEGASPFGCLDMGGNVWEWCLDWYRPSYIVSPGGNLDPTGPLVGTERVIRGGGWNSEPDALAGARRSRLVPGAKDTALGFRVALPAGQPASRRPAE